MNSTIWWDPLPASKFQTNIHYIISVNRHKIETFSILYIKKYDHAA
jgi:hypothetical protein